MRNLIWIAAAALLGGCMATVSGPPRYGIDRPVYDNIDYTYPAFKNTDPRYNRAMRDAGGG